MTYKLHLWILQAHFLPQNDNIWHNDSAKSNERENIFGWILKENDNVWIETSEWSLKMFYISEQNQQL